MTQGARILDGHGLAAAVHARSAERAAELAGHLGRAPTLATWLVGDDPASAVYVASKEEACAQAGVRSLQRRHPADADPSSIAAGIRQDAADPDVDAILLQLPLPAGMDAASLLALVPADKDPDGLHPTNLGLTLAGRARWASCTPQGVMALLDAAGVEVAGAHAVVVGRSTMVGKPMAALLLNRDATVTCCHRGTQDLARHTREAEILVVAVGRAGLIDGSMVRPGACVIDVGINRTDAGLVGDVDAASVAPVAGVLSPVPGGVGPMTVAMLVANTITCAALRGGIDPDSDLVRYQ